MDPNPPSDRITQTKSDSKMWLHLPFFLSNILYLLHLSSRGVVDPFSFGIAASAEVSIQNGSIEYADTFFHFNPGIGGFVIISRLILDISVIKILYFPYTGVFLIFTGYSLSYRISKDPVVSWLIVSVMTLKITRFIYNIWPHGVGYALYLLLIMFVIITINQERIFEKRRIFILIVMLIGINLFSYNSQLWAVSFIGILLIFYLILLRNKMSIRSKMMITFSILSLILFFLVNPIIKNAYLPYVRRANLNLLAVILNWMESKYENSPSYEYQYIGPDSPFPLFVSNFFFFILLIIPLIGLLIDTIYNIAVKKEYFKISTNPFKHNRIILFAIFLVWFADIIAYLPLGATTALTRYLVFLGPLINTEIIKNYFKKRKSLKSKIDARKVYLLTLFILSLSSTFLPYYYQHPILDSDSHYSEVLPAANWYFDHLEEIDETLKYKTFIYSDHITNGQFALVASQKGIFFNPNIMYNQDILYFLIDQNQSLIKSDFFAGHVVVVNLLLINFKTTAGGWNDFIPLAPYLSIIEDNVNLNKIYDDGNIWIFLGE